MMPLLPALAFIVFCAISAWQDFGERKVRHFTRMLGIASLYLAAFYGQLQWLPFIASVAMLFILIWQKASGAGDLAPALITPFDPLMLVIMAVAMLVQLFPVAKAAFERKPWPELHFPYAGICCTAWIGAALIRLAIGL